MLACVRGPTAVFVTDALRAALLPKTEDAYDSSSSSSSTSPPFSYELKQELLFRLFSLLALGTFPLCSLQTKPQNTTSRQCCNLSNVHRMQQQQQQQQQAGPLISTKTISK
ncbi:hypothetical protein Emed_000123 [Eimeria media]